MQTIKIKGESHAKYAENVKKEESAFASLASFARDKKEDVKPDLDFKVFKLGHGNYSTGDEYSG